MILGPISGGAGCRGRNLCWSFLAVLLAFQALAATTNAALPKRLILMIDGICYQDMQALQEGVTYKNLKGRQFHRQAFHQGYFPVHRMISTFPSTSDVAWTDVLGDRPLPGYQRTYYSAALNSQVAVNGITTSMEHELQMTYELESGLLRTLGYVFPRLTFKYEVQDLVKNFLKARSGGDNYYAYIRTTDDAQHLSADILALLCALNEKLEELRARYRAQEGRELEILILSDHGNNHAGPAKRVEVRSFLKQSGYRVAKSIRDPKDVVLPTAGIESWIEIHNAPAETGRLATLLAGMEGVDILSARVPDRENRFVVMNGKGERAAIEFDPAKNAYRYVPESGDPLNYGPVVAALSRQGQFDADGFAAADAWMAETLTNRYPLALERIVRGHTRVTMNPATILISLDNRYVHASWLIKKGSECVRFGGTHGALDDLNSTGMIVSSFGPTQDTSTSRVAALYDGFRGLREYRAEESGAEWINAKGQALTAIPRSPVDSVCRALPSDRVFLRVWSPSFDGPGASAPVAVMFQRIPRFTSAQIRRTDPPANGAFEQRLTLTKPLEFPNGSPYERVYDLPPGLMLEPGNEYRITGWLREQSLEPKLFEFAFRTDARAVPIAY
jgi:hypothetical protein